MDPNNGRNENNEDQQNTPQENSPQQSVGQDNAQNDAPQREEPRREEAQSEESRRRKRRRRGLLIGGVVLLTLFFLTAGTVALVLIVASGETGGGGGGFAGASDTYNEEYVLGEGSNKVVSIPVVGAIASDDVSIDDGPEPTATPEGIEDALRQAEEDASVVAVVLEVDSPGGGVTASDRIYRSIQDFRERSDKPVVAHFGTIAASGGYYVATAADEIVAEETVLTGSLGVILPLTNFSEAADDIGVDQNAITSGRFKNMGSQFEELSPEEREIFQSIVDDSYERFVEVIVEGRDLPRDQVREAADGRIYTGEQARDLDLLDELGGLDRAAERAGELADAGDTRLVRYVQRPQTTGLFPPLVSFGQPEVPEEIEKLTRMIEDTGLMLDGGKPYYIYVPGL